MSVSSFSIPNLWTRPHGHLHQERLRREATEISRSHALPVSPEQWRERAAQLRTALHEKLLITHRLKQDLDVRIHGEIRLDGYKIQRLSFASAPEIRVTANLYIPNGSGPFPAVLNMHGHWPQGKIAARVQARGHVLAKNGIVTLTVDVAGAGERASQERPWKYHGAALAAQLYLFGDSLLGLQVRDNMCAVDVLQSLPFVNAQKIGATGASGGGNQTMWLSALDERIQAAVPVVSVGSFEAYVTRCNCVCETLPGGLPLMDEWGLLGIMAPRPLLILNALHDEPAFGYEPMSYTCRQLEEIYTMLGARHHFDSRLFDMKHGYWEQPLQAMLAWMLHWLKGESSTSPTVLPTWSPIPENDLLCYAEGEKPKSTNYAANRKTLAAQVVRKKPDRNTLVEITGWKFDETMTPKWTRKQTFSDGSHIGSILSPRAIEMPVYATGDLGIAHEIRLFLSPHGKKTTFIEKQLQKTCDAGIIGLAADLPATGELAWENAPVGEARLHDSSRACLWLGYTLVGEWAECIAAICAAVHQESPRAQIEIIAEAETSFAALIALALKPNSLITITEINAPKSLEDKCDESLAWFVPGFLQWGDLDALRAALNAEMQRKNKQI